MLWLREKLKGDLSLQSAILIPLLGFPLLFLVLATSVFLKSQAEMRHTMNLELGSGVRERLEDRVQWFLQASEWILVSSAQSMAEGSAYEEPEVLLSYLLQIVKLFPFVSGISFANTAGGLVNAGRDTLGYHHVFTEDFQAGTLYKYAVDDKGVRQDLLQRTSDYDARKRFWYQVAADKRGESSTEIGVLATHEDFFLSKSRPIYVGEEQVGVLAVKLFLRPISDFLAERKGETFLHLLLLDERGHMLATSTREPLVRKMEDGARTMEMQESINPVVREAGRVFTQEYPGGMGIKEPAVFHFRHVGQEKIGHILPFLQEENLDWYMIILRSKESLADSVREGGLVLLFLVLFLYGGVVLLGVGITKKITRPIAQLTDVARALPEGEWSMKTLPLGFTRETRHLVEAFLQMTKTLETTVTGLTQEVTMREGAQGALLRSEERYRAITDDLPAMVCEFLPDTTLTYVNKAYCAYYDLSQEALLGTSFLRFLPMELREKARNLYASFTREHPLHVQNLYVMRGEGIFWQEWRTRAFFNEKGAVTRVQAIGVDVTERKRAEEKIRQYAVELGLREVERDALLDALNEEMTNAKFAHEHLLQQALPRVCGLTLAQYSNPATFLGADFAQVHRKGDTLFVYIVDITGHGLEGTLFSLAVKHSMDAYFELVSEEELKPHKILEFLDGQIRNGGYPSEYAIALSVLLMNLTTKEIAYSSAGFHTPPLLIYSDGTVFPLVGEGLPISADIPYACMSFSSQTIQMPPDSFLLISTDGLYEQEGNEVRYEERLLCLLRRLVYLSAQTISDAIQRDFQGFLGRNAQLDDVTFVVLSNSLSHTFSVPSEFASLAYVREEAAAFYAKHEDKEGIALAVHELVANAIEHGNQFKKNHPVTLTFSPCGLVVEDVGPGLPPSLRKEGPIDFDGDRGRGCALIRLLVGELVYSEKANRVSLLLPKSAPP